MPSNPVRHFPQRFLLIISCTATLLTFLIILVSAYIRLAESGLGCSPWPACYAHFPADPQTRGLAISLEGDHRILRLLHRVMASILTLMVFIITGISCWYRSKSRIGISLPVTILMVILMLSVLGINTPNRELPFVALGNLIGGFTLLVLLSWLALKLQNREDLPKLSTLPYPPSSIWIIHSILLAVILQIVTGAWASANYSAAACSGLLQCSKVDWTQITASFEPLRRLTLYHTGGMLEDAATAPIMLGHHLVAVVITAVIAVCLYPLFRQAVDLRPGIVVIFFFLLIDFALGVLGSQFGMPLWVGTLHSLFSIMLLLAAFHLAFRIHAGVRQEQVL